MKPRYGAALATLGLVAGCGGSPTRPPSPSLSTTPSSAQSATGLGGGEGQTPAPTTRASTSAPTVVTPVPVAPVREIAGTCPYIANADVQQIEGDRVGRSSILTSKPVGCRFYFQYDDSAIVAEITVLTYPTPTAAFNAMVLSAGNHPELVTDKDIGAGAVAFRALLQGVLTWQCRFAKGVQVVTVHTRQPDPSYNARALARQLAPRF